MKYTIQVALVNIRQVEIETDDPLEWPELKKLAEEKAREEFGSYDEISVED